LVFFQVLGILHTKKVEFRNTLHFGIWNFSKLGVGSCGVPVSCISPPNRPARVCSYMGTAIPPDFALKSLCLPRSHRCLFGLVAFFMPSSCSSRCCCGFIIIRALILLLLLVSLRLTSAVFSNLRVLFSSVDPSDPLFCLIESSSSSSSPSFAIP
jgi:hypothetical protein